MSIMYHGEDCVIPFKVHPRLNRSATCIDPYLSYQNYLTQANFDKAWSLVDTDGSSILIIVVDDGIGDHFELPVGKSAFPSTTTILECMPPR